MANAKIKLKDMAALSVTASDVSDLLKFLTVIQQTISTHGSGENKRSVLRSDPFLKMLEQMNENELESILTPVVPAIKRIIRQKVDILNSHYNIQIENPE